MALTLLMRVVVPAGWMPAVAGGQLITICSGMGEAKIWLDADGNPVKAPHDGKPATDGPCAFAAGFSALDIPPAAAIAVPAIYAGLVLPAREVVAIGRGLAAPPPPAIGPPNLN